MGISPHRAATSHRGAELYHLKTQRLQTRAREARREVQPAPAFNQLMHLNNSTPASPPGLSCTLANESINFDRRNTQSFSATKNETGGRRYTAKNACLEKGGQNQNKKLN